MPLLSDHRRSLFAVRVNDLITDQYKLEAELDKAHPDPDFKIERQEYDLKNPRPYQDLLNGKTMRRKHIVEANIVETLHEDPVLSDFLKYLDQLCADKKSDVGVDKKNLLQRKANIAFDLLKELMRQVCSFGIEESFNQKIQLIKDSLKGKRGQRISNYFEKSKQRLANELDPNFFQRLISGLEIKFDTAPASVYDRAQNLGLRLFTGSN